MNSPIEVFPIAIGVYDNYDALDVDPEVERVVKLLREFAAEISRPWLVHMNDRGSDAVHARLREFQEGPEGPVILYWLGHGWSDTSSAALVHARSTRPPGATGIKPVDVADVVSRWEAQTAAEDAWLLVIIDSCKATRFAELLAAALDDIGGRRHVIILGTSANASTALGRFTSVLEVIVKNTFADDISVSLVSLVDELKSHLGGVCRILNVPFDTRLRRRAPIVSGYSGSLDAREQLNAIIRELPGDERRHFLTKAHGGELVIDGDAFGELTWHFSGRGRERHEVVSRLRRDAMIVVTGRPGSGKSALLGDILVRSRPALASALLEHGLIQPAAHPPPPSFDSVIHLTGISRDQLMARLAADFGIMPVSPSRTFSDQLEEMRYRLNELQHRRTAELQRRRTTELQESECEFHVLVDGLDEAVEPLHIAVVLRRLSTVRGMHLLVGSRTSTRATLDSPDPSDTNLLTALGVDASASVNIAADPQATFDYLDDRLRNVAGQNGVTREDIRRAARAVANAGQEFLYARLAAYELLAEPHRLLAEDVFDQLGRDHRALFALTVERLTRQNLEFHQLLEALALAKGRGAPILGGVWVGISSALADGRNVASSAVHGLIESASPYLTVDQEYGQTVYRLAHRTFEEHFSSDVGKMTAKHDLIAEFAISTIEKSVSRNPYWLNYTSSHCASGSRAIWDRLAESPALDVLSPVAVATDAMRSLFALGPMPAKMAAVIATAHYPISIGWRGIRDIAAARFGMPHAISPKGAESDAWSLDWASVRRRRFHAVLTGHVDGVKTLTPLRLSDGRVVLATGGQDSTVRLWDTDTGGIVGDPLVGHQGAVKAAAQVVQSDGRVLLATGSQDGTVRLWDPIVGRQVGEPLLGHHGAVSQVAPVPLPDGRVLLASGGVDGTVRVWDTSTGHTVGRPVPVPQGAVLLVEAEGVVDGVSLLLIATDGRVQLRDSLTGAAVRSAPLRPKAALLSATTLQLADGRVLMAGGGADGTVRLWDPTSGRQAGNPFEGHTRGVLALASLNLANGKALLATGSIDGTARLWDTAGGYQIGEPFWGRSGTLLSVGLVERPDGRLILATGGEDGTLRLWDASETNQGDEPFVPPSEVMAVASLPLQDGEPVLATGEEHGTLRFWTVRTGRPKGRPTIAHSGGVLAMASVKMPGGAVLLATGGGDGTARLWDPRTGRQFGEPISPQSGAVSALASIRLPNGSVLVATGGTEGKAQLWDPTTRSTVGQPIGIQSDPISGIAILPTERRTLVAICTNRGLLQLWDAGTGSLLDDIPEQFSAGVSALASIHSTSGELLLAIGDDRGVVNIRRPGVLTELRRSGDLRTFRPSLRAPSGASSVAAIAPVETPNGRLLVAAGSSDGNLRLWSMESREAMLTIPIDARIHALSAVPKGRLALGLDEGVMVLDFHDLKQPF